MKKIYFATTNIYKLKYAQKFMENIINIEDVKLNIDEPQSLDQEYVACCKVNKAFEVLKKPVFCEDVGLYMEKYNSFPGVLTAYVVSGIGINGIKNLINEGDLAFYKAVIAYKDSDCNFTCETIMKGKLTIERMSKNYSIYTPFKSMFIPEGYKVPIADMSEEEQSKLSYNKDHYDLFLKKLKELDKI